MVLCPVYLEFWDSDCFEEHSKSCESLQNKIAQKVSEESSELIIDYLNGSKKRTIEEASDLIYHLFVLLHSKKIKLEDIKKELKSRHNVRRK